MKRTLAGFHSRLLIAILALALALFALASAPAAADDPVPEGRECEGGCINWNAQDGCVTYQVCCVYDDGSYQCWEF